MDKKKHFYRVGSDSGGWDDLPVESDELRHPADKIIVVEVSGPYGTKTKFVPGASLGRQL